ncbi:MFS transporter [Kitasatospora sp. RB6PN24]|uniref:MFS transporter n=1 Tax=Kitasatospora humi TaxID=2893891 RepID=UPI001E2BEB82|nr:MFS transporter [Kitasatospora humi]MCC9307348.1 MFS transporter [Kitasatospora humi]
MTRVEDARPTRTTGGVAPLLASTGISVTGDGAFLAAAPLLAASLTRNPLEVSSVTAAFYAPWLVAGLPAGALADRWPRRAVMISADLTRAAVLSALALVIATGHASLPLLITAILLVGVAQCFFDSASQAVIPTLIERNKEALARTNGRYWAIDTVGRSLAGPPLGTATFAVNRLLPFAADAFSFVASALCISRLPRLPAASKQPEPLTAAIRTGLQHLRSTPELRVLSATLATYNYAYNIAFATFVLYATRTLHVADAGYGLLLATAAVGGILAGWRAAPLTRRLSYRQVVAIACLAQGVVWFGIALLPNIFAAGVFLMLLGAASSLISVAASSGRQAMTPDHLLGRVVSVFRFFGVGAAALGALTGGAIASAAGLRAPLWIAAIILGIAASVTWPWRRQR